MIIQWNSLIIMNQVFVEFIGVVQLLKVIFWQIILLSSEPILNFHGKNRLLTNYTTCSIKTVRTIFWSKNMVTVTPVHSIYFLSIRQNSIYELCLAFTRLVDMCKITFTMRNGLFPLFHVLYSQTLLQEAYFYAT